VYLTGKFLLVPPQFLHCSYNLKFGKNLASLTTILLGFLQQSSIVLFLHIHNSRIYKYRGTQFRNTFLLLHFYILQIILLFLKGKTNIECSLSDRRFVFSMQKYKSRFCSKNLFGFLKKFSALTR
jgi:hypothetical protein